MILLNTATSEQLHRLHMAAFGNGWAEDEFARMLQVQGTFSLAGEGGFILCRSLHEQCEILTLAVAPQQQRKGLGLALVQAATQEAKGRGASRVFLEVSEHNDAALHLYEKAGFTVISRRRAYYKNAEGSHSDAVVMAYTL